MRHGIALLTIASVVSAVPAGASGQGSGQTQQGGTASSTIDDRLFRDLGGLRTEVDTAPSQAESERAPAEIASGSALGEASQTNSWDLIGRQMRQIQSRLEKADDGPDTLRIQQRIVEQLEQLWRQAPRSPGRSAAQGGQALQQGPPETSTRQAPPGPSPQDDTRVTEPTGAATDSPRELLQQAWGHLPAQLRQQLQSVGQEQFLPQYARQIEAYYRSLSASGPTSP